MSATKPGEEPPEVVVMMVLGIVGAVLGGLISTMLGEWELQDGGTVGSIGNIISSILGVVILPLLYKLLRRKRRNGIQDSGGRIQGR